MLLRTNSFDLFFFKGFVISDWQGIDRITSPPHSNYTHSVLAGVQAGIDMVSFLVLSFVILHMLFRLLVL